MLLVPADALGKPFIWYAEVVGLPAGTVSDALEAGSMLARFERHDGKLLARDLTTTSTRLSGTADDAPLSGAPSSTGDSTAVPETLDGRERPVEAALNLIETGPVAASFPILGETADGASSSMRHRSSRTISKAPRAATSSRSAAASSRHPIRRAPISSGSRRARLRSTSALTSPFWPPIRQARPRASSPSRW